MMKYINALTESQVVKFLSAYHSKGCKFESDSYFDEICDFGWVYSVVVNKKNGDKLCEYRLTIHDFSFIGTVSHGAKNLQKVDYSETWQEYIYRLLNIGILKAHKGNQKSYKEDCDKENEINKKHTNNL